MIPVKPFVKAKGRDYVIKVKTGAIWSALKRHPGHDNPRQWRKDRLGADHGPKSMPLGYTTFEFVPTSNKNINRFKPLE